MTVVSFQPNLHRDAALRRARWGRRYFQALLILLLGYVLDGRGFAYLGVPPIFLGELALFAGLFLLLIIPGWFRILSRPPIVVLTVFWIWGLLRTFPYVDAYGFAAVRDTVIFAYSLFALIVIAVLLDQPGLLAHAVRAYRRFIPILLVGFIFVATMYRGFYPISPYWPWAPGVAIVQEKESDVMVHLCGIFTFWATGLAAQPSLLWYLLFAGEAAFTGSIDRASFVSFGAVFGLCFLAKPRNPATWHFLAIVTIALVALWASDFQLQLTGAKDRGFSFDQVSTSVVSMFSDTGDVGMDSNKAWRLNWWNDIVGYTLHGPYFWTGKGFGINLADDDGYQVLADSSLRSPHSAHMCILARAGVPGLALWILLHATWLARMAGGYLLAWRRDHRRWSGFFLFLIAYYVAALINSSFDVYLEGPMGGIWFWCVFGTGLAARELYDSHPYLLQDP